MDIENYPDRFAETHAGKTVLITGGSGFMGKVLVEKYLRCFEMKRLYLLVRSKKGKDPNERLKDIFANPLFDLVKKEKGQDVFKKCIAIAGDISELGLGLSKEDRQTLIDEVEIIVHGAATIRFDDPLKKAVIINVRGTKFMLELAKEVKNLYVFVHISTSYCHLNERVLYEKVYPPPANPHHVIKTVEWMDEAVVDTITAKILGDIPNTYAFTKALGEALVADELDNLPVIILRPSIVIPIWKEPAPGWTDNINGPTGLLIGAGKGVIRTMYCNQDSYADFLPVDIFVNAILVCTVKELRKDQRIFNITSSSDYKLSWNEIVDIGREVINTRIPLNGVVWYPGGSMKKSKIMHLICVVLFHYLPALLIDTLLFCLGYKPVLWRVQNRVSKGFEVFEYYANNQWDFNNDEAYKARDRMNPKERHKYKVDGIGINFHDYFTDCIHASRLYILKETDDTIPAAKRHMKVMWWVDKICKVLLFFGVSYLLYKYVFAPVLTLAL